MAGDSSFSLTPTRQMLLDLSERIRSHDIPAEGPNPGYTMLIDVVGDIGRSLPVAEPSELKGLLPAIAVVREGLEEENDLRFGRVARTPKEALAEEKLSTAYAAGALWACTSVLTGFLEQQQARRDQRSRRASRAEVRQAVKDLVATRGPSRPSDVIAYLEASETEVDPTVVSHAISDLIEQGHLEQAPAPRNAEDRRARYYRAADQDDATDNFRLQVRGMLNEVYAEAPPRVAEEVVRDELERRATRSHDERGPA